MKISEVISFLQATIKDYYGCKNTLFPTLSLLEYVTKKPGWWILAHPEKRLYSKQIENVKIIKKRIEKYEPLQYITGFAEFWNLKFKVNRNVLIPRPETEWIVDRALRWLEKKSKEIKNKKIKIIDIGTGSGCIIISMAKEIEMFKNSSIFEFYATDISKKALEVAKENALKNLGKRYKDIKFIRTNFFPKNMHFNVVLANLPYLSEKDFKKLPSYIKNYEPKNALIGGKYGVEKIQEAVTLLPPHLEEDGIAFFEIPPEYHTTIDLYAKKFGLKPKYYPIHYLVSFSF